MKKTLLLFVISLPLSAFAGTDIINSVRMSSQVEFMVQTALAKCKIQEGNSHISFGMPCETYLNDANSILFNLSDSKLRKLRKQIVSYANIHNIQLDQRFISDL